MADFAQFKDRRDRFAETVADGFAIIPASTEQLRNSDVHNGFRQDSDFFHLTGFEEPDAVAVIDPDQPSEKYVLFVRPKDRQREIWDGYRAGPEGAVSIYGADAAYPIGDLDAKLREYAEGATTIWYRMGGRLDSVVNSLLQTGRGLLARGLAGPAVIADPSPALHELRVRKDPAEMHALRSACTISGDGFVDAMHYTKPGLFEYQVQAVMESNWRIAGSRRNGYPSIVGSGPNACILHYGENARRIEDGDLVLIDAGAEYDYLTADVTRTYPANGRFTPAQREVYEVVLTALHAATAVARAGAPYNAMQQAASRVLAEGLVEMGAMPRRLEDTLAMHHYRELTIHSIGHFLGRDVHDVGFTRVNGAPRALEPGMVVTVEPGLYFSPDNQTVTFHMREFDLDEMLDRRARLGLQAAEKIEKEERENAEKIEHVVPERLRGIGIRIEDNIVVTPGAPEILTASCPKSIDDVEGVCT